MGKSLAAAALLLLGFAGTALACESADTAMSSTPTVTTAQGGTATPAPAPEAPKSGG